MNRRTSQRLHPATLLIIGCLYAALVIAVALLATALQGGAA